MNKPLAPETLAAQAMGTIDEATGAIVPPVHLTSTYERDADLSYPRGLAYGRPDNATVRQAEAVITALEGGHVTLLLPSGMAAATTLFLALERPAHVVAPRVIYWGLRQWLTDDAPGFGLDVTFVDDCDPETIAAAVRPGSTQLIWIETPANPLWSIADIAAVGNVARQAGALLGVDSTVATPVLSQPLSLGADVVMHSATKYLNGHSDVLAGSLTFARPDAVLERAAGLRAHMGGIIGPFEAALLMRGMRTLHVRVRHQCQSAMAIARFLGDHSAVCEVLYPGLTKAAGHDIARRQMAGGFGGMLSIRLADGERAAIETAARLKIWKRATSLGGVESLVEHRASVEGLGSPCPPDLLRLSVGLETADDLICDLEQALP